MQPDVTSVPRAVASGDLGSCSQAPVVLPQGRGSGLRVRDPQVCQESLWEQELSSHCPLVRLPQTSLEGTWLRGGASKKAGNWGQVGPGGR